jgi:hypothetical protein
MHWLLFFVFFFQKLISTIMKKQLSVFINSALLASGLTFAASNFCAANAASLNFNINDYTGDRAKVAFELEEIGNEVKVSVDIVKPPTVNGDLQWVFFDLADDNLLSHLKVKNLYVNNATTVTKATPTSLIAADKVSIVGDIKRNSDPKNFDYGIEISSPGSKNGLVSSATFTLYMAAGAPQKNVDIDWFASEDFGARLQSTGARKEGSSKLQGSASTAAVPEPLTMMGAGAAIGFGVVFKKRLVNGRSS